MGDTEFLAHHGVKGQKWGVRRYQNRSSNSPHKVHSRGFKGKDGKELSLDRKAGTNTVYAIKQYQKSRGLTVDGICGTNTWKDLIAI